MATRKLLMVMFGSFLRGFCCSFIFDVLGFITKYIFRLKTNYADQGENAEYFGAIQSLSDDQTVQNSCRDLICDGFEENEKDLNREREVTEDSVFKQEGFSSSESKYVFLSSKNVSAFLIEPEVISFTVEEMFVGLKDVGITKEILEFQSEDGYRVLDDEVVQEYITETVSEKIDQFGESSCSEENLEIKEEPSPEIGILEDDEISEIKDNSEKNKNKDFSKELISFEGDKFFLSSAEYGDEILNLEASTSDGESKLEIFNKILEADGEQNCDEEFIELKPYIEDHGDAHVEKFSQENVSKFEDLCQRCEERILDSNLEVEDSDEEDGFDILQEHKYLVKRMKMEMRYSKVKGLPTIFEECESQKTFVDDLEPLSIDDEKLGYKDHMAEIQKFHATFSEKMKKLDILNYQTLHAISFLHLKDSKTLMDRNKTPISVMKPYIPKLWSYKQHKIYAESNDRLATSTHQDLEFVYVGQVCNSWEILSWQYAKVRELLEFDSDHRHHSYNKVASEFQQFQVLLERFLEDEAFQGPRILHYLKTRCILRTLLQIPMIKEDCLEDRKGLEAEEEQINVSLSELADMTRQSMQVFWEFLSTEKVENKLRSKVRTLVDQHDPADAKLYNDIRLALQQKERKLKDILRSRNCIVKKFHRYENGAQNHAVLTSQVELKLVSKVLNLRKLATDQLMWCQRKLDNNCFIGRKVHVECSFFLLPC